MNRVFGLMVAVTACSVSVYAASLTTPLKTSDELARVAAAVGTQLADGNISTGTTRLYAAQLKEKLPTSLAERKALAAALFAEDFKHWTDQDLPTEARVKYTARVFNDSAVSEIVDALVAGNDYNPDNKEIRTGLTRQVWAVLRKLPTSDLSVLLSAQTRLRDDSSSAYRKIWHFAVVAPTTRKIVQVFVIEGSM